jgi:hypothetical protein
MALALTESSFGSSRAEFEFVLELVSILQQLYRVELESFGKRGRLRTKITGHRTYVTEIAVTSQ